MPNVLDGVGRDLAVERRLDREERQARPGELRGPVRRHPLRLLEAALRAIGLEPRRVFVRQTPGGRFGCDALRMVVGKRGRPVIPAAQLPGVREKGGAELDGILEPARSEPRRRRRVAPQAREMLRARAIAELATSHQDPVALPSGPKRAIGKRVAEGAGHRPRPLRLELRDRQPIGREPAGREALGKRHEIFARIQVHHTREYFMALAERR